VKQYWADAATRNCVWLFQTREIVITNRSDLDYLSRSEIIEGCLNHTKSIREIIDYVKEYEDEGIYPDCLAELEKDIWYTEAVFLFREEARNHGKQRPYEWGKEGEGWRIYGVPIMGAAAQLLSEAGVNQELIDKNLQVKNKD
jgi:hypothetical protein